MSITLYSTEGQTFVLNIESAKRSNFLQSRIENQNTEIKFDTIRADVMKLVVEYLDHYRDREPTPIPDVLNSNELSNELKDEWDIKFIMSVNYEVAFHLINAGVLLELNHLHDLACSRIAAFMKGKSVEEVFELEEND